MAIATILQPNSALFELQLAEQLKRNPAVQELLSLQQELVMSPREADKLVVVAVSETIDNFVHGLVTGANLFSRERSITNV